MCRRFNDVTGCLTLPIRVVLWIHLLGVLNSQQLPSRDSHYAFGIDQRQVFYDNNRIPDGIEVTPYLFHNSTKKFFFLLEDPTDRLEFSVTPCASPTIWHVTHKPRRGNIYDFEDAVENSVEGLRLAIDKKSYLFTSSGESAETLRLDQPKLGIYTVDVISTRSDSYVQIFATTSPEVNRFPELPTDSSINKSQVTSKGFRVTWKPSPDEPHFGEEIEYCVSVSKKRSFQTLCSVLAHLNGDPKPTLPPGSGFGFSFDISRKKLLKHSAKPIEPAKRGSIFYKCVGQEKTFFFDRIKRGGKFYVNVFVKNKLSGKSMPYKTIRIKIRRKRKLHTLKDGRSKRILFSKKDKNKVYKFHVKRTSKDVNIAVHSCVGQLAVKVDMGNVTVYNSRVSSELISLPKLPVGVYVLTLTKTFRRRVNVYLTVQTSAVGKMVPKLPAERTVAVFDYLTSCDRITVAWMGTKKKQNYCLYKTEVPLSSKAHSMSLYKRLDQCSAFKRLGKGAKKITCKKFKYTSKSNSVLAITVTGLERGKTYIFDVFVNKGQHFTFPYGSVRTKTKTTDCNLPT